MNLPSPLHLNTLAYVLLDDEEINVEETEAKKVVETVTDESREIEIVQGIEEKELTIYESRFNIFVDDFKDDMKKLGRASYDKYEKRFNVDLDTQLMRDLMLALAKNQKGSTEAWQIVVDSIVKTSNKVTNHFGTGYLFELFSTMTGDKLIKLEVQDGIVLYDDTIEY